MESNLSMKDRELIAVGASVAGGCVPCTEYHLKAVQAEGASGEEIVRAVDVALCVKDDSRKIMRRIVAEALDVDAAEEPSYQGTFGGREQACCQRRGDPMTELISLAAAVAVNCPKSFHHYAQAARNAGANEHDIVLAVGFARMIRARATEKMDQASVEGATTLGAQQQAATCGPTAASAVATARAACGSASPAKNGTSCCGPA